MDIPRTASRDTFQNEGRVLKLLKKYVVAKYLRISSEDGDKSESDSIENQRNLIDYNIPKYFADRNIELIELVDDGYTGTNMNRPGMRKLLILAEAGEIDCVIVKDFSRFARDYVDFGTYVEKKFPAWNTRFISVNDGYDSINFCGITGGVDIALKSIAYAMYSRDLSEKNKSAVRVLNKNGKFTGAYCLYGYIKSPEDKRKLIIDPVASEIVKRIFNMRTNGMTATEIAHILNQEKIMTPGEYKEATIPNSREWKNSKGYSQWSSDTVSRILHNEQYTGKLISGKSESIVVGSQKKRLTPKESHIVANNAFEAIISQELFDSVQPETKPIKKSIKSNALFRGKLRCGGCGHVMEAAKISGKGFKYYCRYEKLNSKQNCVHERIYENDLSDFIYELIKKELQRALDIQKANDTIASTLKRNEQALKALANKINAEKRKKLDDYIRLTKGELSEEAFAKRREPIDEKIIEYSEKERIMQGETISKEDVSAVELFGRYVGIEKLKRAIIEDLIKVIYVYDDKRIEVIWNFKEKAN